MTKKPETLTLLPGQFQLQANIESIIGGGATGGFLRITLCGFANIIPFSKPSPAGMLADAGVPQLVGPQASSPLSVALFCNDSITPDNTFYEIAVLDANQNVVQSGNYQFNGIAGTTVDLSTQPQIVQPTGFVPGGIKYLPCAGTVPGTVYTAPGPVLAVSYNGIFLRANQALPILSYTVVGEAITLNFTTQIGDRIDALCISLP